MFQSQPRLIFIEDVKDVDSRKSRCHRLCSCLDIANLFGSSRVFPFNPDDDEDDKPIRILCTKSRLDSGPTDRTPVTTLKTFVEVPSLAGSPTLSQRSRASVESNMPRSAKESRSRPASALQLSKSSVTLGESPDEKNRPSTRVINRNPKQDDIAKLPIILSHSDQDLRRKSPENPQSESRYGPKFVLPPLPNIKSGAAGDVSSLSLNQLSPNPAHFGAGENLSFSLPTVHKGPSASSSNCKHSEMVVRKGGLAFDIILPSTGKDALPPLVRQSSKLTERKLEPENFKKKLDRAEKRRKAREEQIRRSNDHRQSALEQYKADQTSYFHEISQNLAKKMERASEKRQEQLRKRQIASRRRIERVKNRSRRKSESALIETDDMSSEDLWTLMTGNDGEIALGKSGEKNIPWWERGGKEDKGWK